MAAVTVVITEMSLFLFHLLLGFVLPLLQYQTSSRRRTYNVSPVKLQVNKFTVGEQ